MFSLSASARRRGLIGSGLVAAAAMVAASLAPASDAATSAASGTGFKQTNLVSDVPGLAQITDFRVSNPWGIALCADTPVWINNNNTATSEVYQGANGTDPLTRKLVVETPAGLTGIACNTTDAFVAHQDGQDVPTKFLFNGFDGYTSGWGPTANPINEAIPTLFKRRNGYAGMAIAQTSRGPRLYVAAFTGLQVMNGHFKVLKTKGRFIDPKIPKGNQPYNVAVFGHRLYVAYADLQGGGNFGAVAVFTFRGKLIKHLSSDKRLKAPWGMAIAPKHWGGGFGGMLLVGNVNSGKIDVLDPVTGAFKGKLRDANHKAIVNEGLWGLAFGNGITGTPRTLLFLAGIDGYTHGLFGMITPN